MPILLTCLACRCPFVAKWRRELRPVYESIRDMKAAGRTNLKRTGERWTRVLPALCEECREKEIE